MKDQKICLVSTFDCSRVVVLLCRKHIIEFSVSVVRARDIAYQLIRQLEVWEMCDKRTWKFERSQSIRREDFIITTVEAITSQRKMILILS